MSLIQGLRLSVLALAGALVLSGCNQQMEEFVGSSGGKTREQTPPAGISATEGKIKFSPGAVTAVSESFSLRAHLTPTEQLLTGSGVSARVGISGTQMR